MIKALAALRDILLLFRDILVRWDRAIRKSRAVKAVEDSKKQSSQKPLEKHISGSSGKPTRHKYHGLSIRKKKRRD